MYAGVSSIESRTRAGMMKELNKQQEDRWIAGRRARRRARPRYDRAEEGVVCLGTAGGLVTAAGRGRHIGIGFQCRIDSMDWFVSLQHIHRKQAKQDMASSAPCPKPKRPMLTFDGLDAGVDPFPSLAAAKPGAQPKAVLSPTLETELELVELRKR